MANATDIVKDMIGHNRAIDGSCWFCGNPAGGYGANFCSKECAIRYGRTPSRNSGFHYYP